VSTSKYYAIFYPIDEKIGIKFPDLNNCKISGNDLLDALDIAEEILRSYLSNYKKQGRKFPEASSANSIKIPDGANLIMIEVNNSFCQPI
jgi:predicted RNase H-like HicB family nuclease